ncbi:MAG: O-acetyl-ADP-ribose deacetylase [Bryobacteraceae bacterium]|nr:O-acetyl-ADP-ribose deacetylase [Bryobacteraceae bacterium]
MEKEFPGGRTLKLVGGDITKLAAEAIVNAANAGLRGGGGVDGAIHRAGGPEIMRELDGIRAAEGGCPTGSAVATTAGKLPARYIFHAVGPIFRGGGQGEAEALASCYAVCMKMASERALRSISFPSISTGVYGYPVEQAARIALTTVARALEADTTVETATFVLFDEATFQAYRRALAGLHAQSLE